MSKNTKRELTLEREQYEGKDGKRYWDYLVRGIVRGRDIIIDFVPKDIGRHEALDIVFDTDTTATLIMANEITIDSNNKKVEYVSYKVRNVDKDGIVYECSIRPARSTDKSLLTMLLDTLNAQKAEG